MDGVVVEMEGEGLDFGIRPLGVCDYFRFCFCWG